MTRRSAPPSRRCVANAAQPVRMAEKPTHGARIEAPSTRGEEERVDGASRQLGPPVAEVASDVVGSLLTERHDPLLATLPAHVDGLALEVDVGEIEPHCLCAPEPARIEELEQRAVSQRERRVAIRELEQLLDLGSSGSVRKPARSPV